MGRFLKKWVIISPLLGLLTLVSIVYREVCRLRLVFYRFGLFKPRRLNALVISIGNLTFGGTGKTPLVIELAEYLGKAGLKVGILSRGYKGRRKDDLQWVSDGNQILGSPQEVGDEPYLMASRLRVIPVVVGKDRYRSGQCLLERFKVDVVFLDDGYQHLSIHRDIDLLVLDATAPFSPVHLDNRLIPHGVLREPLSGIQRASAVLVSRMEQSDQFDKIRRTVRHYHPTVPIFQVFFRPTELIDLSSSKHVDASSLKGKSILAFSGIGHPGSFRFFLEDLGANVAVEVVLNDHHNYTRDDIHNLREKAQKEKVDILVTTEKDGIKIREFLNPSDRVWALRIGLERIEDQQTWEHFIGERIKKN